jgi:CubicO group peptidase (beta-lactamase class C family)
MTIFHLLTHTAGFQGLATPPAARRGLKSADGTVAGFVKAAMDGSLDAQPGETFNYTNSGYFILGHLIQKISGQSYERFIEDNIFTPLQMKETTLEKGAENPNTAAGFRSTTADLLRWQLALWRQGAVCRVAAKDDNIVQGRQGTSQERATRVR